MHCIKWEKRQCCNAAEELNNKETENNVIMQNGPCQNKVYDSFFHQRAESHWLVAGLAKGLDWYL